MMWGGGAERRPRSCKKSLPSGQYRDWLEVGTIDYVKAYFFLLLLVGIYEESIRALLVMLCYIKIESVLSDFIGSFWTKIH